MARQYCRYCAHAVVTTQGTCWCEELKKDIPERTAKAKNACKSFAFLERDAYDPTRIYRPERKSENKDQLDLFTVTDPEHAGQMRFGCAAKIEIPDEMDNIPEEIKQEAENLLKRPIPANNREKVHTLEKKQCEKSAHAPPKP